MPVLLWTAALIFLLVAAVIAFALFARRREHLRAPWRQVGRRGIAMASLVVLSVYVAIGLLDSMHYRPSLPASSQDEPTAYSTEVLSVFDRLVVHLRDMEEKTYSAPFATHLFVKETVEAPDGMRGAIASWISLRRGCAPPSAASFCGWACRGRSSPCGPAATGDVSAMPRQRFCMAAPRCAGGRCW